MIGVAVVVMLSVATQAPAAEGKRVLTFQQVLEKAEGQSPDLKVIRARLEQARAGAQKAWSYYLPQVSVGGSYTRNSVEQVFPSFAIRDVGAPTSGAGLPGQPTTLVLVPGTEPAITIQPLDQWGGQAQFSQVLIAPSLFFAIQNAHLGAELAEENVEGARRDLLFGVAQLYFGAAGLKQAVGVQERQLEITREREKDANLRYETGSQPKVALLRAQIDRARAEQDLLRARNSYQASKIALATLLDEREDFEVVIPDEPVLPEGIESIEAEALKARPDIRAAKKNLELAEGLRKGVWARYAPSIGLSGAYRMSNSGGFSGETDTWLITVGVNWVLFDGGLREAELRESSARIAEAKASQQSALNRAVDEIRRGVLELQSARANRIKAQEQLSLARENQKLVQVAYSAGAATYLETADATAALLAAETGAVGESISASLAALRVLRAAGRFATGSP